MDRKNHENEIMKKDGETSYNDERENGENEDGENGHPVES
jgi:hypothetical protein